MLRTLFAALMVLSTVAPCAAGEVFVDRAAQAGLDFVHFNGMSGELYFSEMMGQGVALFDYDNDGDLDAYLVQGTMIGKDKTLEDATLEPKHPVPLTDRLYRNDLEVRPDGSRVLRFTDVTEEAGLEASAYGMGVIAGDYDNDGWTDLYVTNLGPNQMLRNRGADADGRVTFEDVTAQTGTGDPLWGVPAVFFDYDRDGWLDLYVGNYVNYRVATNKPCSSPTGVRDYCGPSAFEPEPDRLFHNRGPDADGRVTFEDVTVRSGLSKAFGAALGATAADFDGDGHMDLYVANDGMANQLWINQGDGTFVDDALFGGCAVNEEGQPEASMGVVPGDFDGDGDVDLFMTHLERETNTLYFNDGTGLFEDRSEESGLARSSWIFTGFGTGLVDYDNDGWQDLFIANGAVTLLWDQLGEGVTYALAQRNILFRNEGRARFREVSADEGGSVLELVEVSRGVAAGDVDQDGDSDLLVVNSAGPARLLVNQVGQDRPWLGLRLVGGDPPRDMLGAKVLLEREGASTLWRQVRTDGSYASSNDPRLLFGLSGGADVERATVHWPSGRVEQFTELPVGSYTTLREGTGKPVP